MSAHGSDENLFQQALRIQRDLEVAKLKTRHDRLITDPKENKQTDLLYFTTVAARYLRCTEIIFHSWSRVPEPSWHY